MYSAFFMLCTVALLAKNTITIFTYTVNTNLVPRASYLHIGRGLPDIKQARSPVNEVAVHTTKEDKIVVVQLRLINVFAVGRFQSF